MKRSLALMCGTATFFAWAAASQAAVPAPRPIPSNKFTQALCATIQDEAQKNTCLRNQINAYNSCNRRQGQQRLTCFRDFCGRVPDGPLKKECQRTLARFDEDKEKELHQKIAAVRQDVAKLEGQQNQLRNEGRALCRQLWSETTRRSCEIGFGAKLPPQKLR